MCSASSTRCKVFFIKELTADDDVAALVALLNRRPVPGQPSVTEAMARQTLNCSVPVDQEFDDPMESTHVLVMAERRHDLVGAVAYGDTKQGVRYLLWISHNGYENTATLIDAALARWNGPVQAFAYASTVSLGLNGLPVQHNRRVHEVLLSRGFRGRDLRSYQVLALTPTVEQCDVGFIEQRDVTNADGEVVSHYHVEIPHHSVGILWWLETQAECRGRGYGRKVLGEALVRLADHGASRVILYIDDAVTLDERDYRAGKALFSSVGFREVDRLWSYSRGVIPVTSTPV